MTLRDLKESILNNTLTNSFKIIVCEDTSFIIDQYLQKFCDKRRCDLNNLTSLSETQTTFSLVFDFQNTNILNILRVESFAEDYKDYSQFLNCIVICKKVDKKIQEKVAEYIIEVPKLLDWQVKDYIKVNCPGLSQQAIDWLYNITAGNIYKIDSEISKIKLFPKEEQLQVLSDLKFDKLSDLYIADRFTLSNAIEKNNKAIIADYLKHRYCYQVNIFDMIKLLTNRFKAILAINYSTGISPEELGITAKQVSYFYTNKFSKSALIEVLKFLTSINCNLTSGQLQLSDDLFLDYVLCKVLYILEKRG